MKATYQMEGLTSAGLPAGDGALLDFIIAVSKTKSTHPILARGYIYFKICK